MTYDLMSELCHNLPIDESGYNLDTSDNSNPHYSSARLLNAAEDPQQGHRWMVTMVNRRTGAEELLDILCEGGSFREMAQEVRRHFSYDWEIFEWFDPEVPF